jgi:hypothetical protein
MNKQTESYLIISAVSVGALAVATILFKKYGGIDNFFEYEQVPTNPRRTKSRFVNRQTLKSRKTALSALEGDDSNIKEMSQKSRILTKTQTPTKQKTVRSK